MKTRICGAVHPRDGVVCEIPVYTEPGCCTDRVYAHKEPHEAVDNRGVITHRWEEVLVVKDLPYDAYQPQLRE